jgi:hypothetical protein
MNKKISNCSAHSIVAAAVVVVEYIQAKKNNIF